MTITVIQAINRGSEQTGGCEEGGPLLMVGVGVAELGRVIVARVVVAISWAPLAILSKVVDMLEIECRFGQTLVAPSGCYSIRTVIPGLRRRVGSSARKIRMCVTLIPKSVFSTWGI
jgi:hypothetical protein